MTADAMDYVNSIRMLDCVSAVYRYTYLRSAWIKLLNIIRRASCASKWSNEQHAEKVWETEITCQSDKQNIVFCVRAENILLSQVNDYKMNWFCALPVHRKRTYNVLNGVRRVVCILYYIYCTTNSSFIARARLNKRRIWYDLH